MEYIIRRRFLFVTAASNWQIHDLHCKKLNARDKGVVTPNAQTLCNIYQPSLPRITDIARTYIKHKLRQRKATKGSMSK